jgi:GT2 family glycosyltransferase
LTRLQEVLVPGLRSLGLPAEVIVVANGCSDGTEQVSEAAGFKSISFPKPLTPAEARNIGVQASSGEYLIFVDADVVPHDIWFRTVGKLPSPGSDDVAIGYPYCVPPNWHWLAVAFEQVRIGRGRLPRYINSGNLIVTRRLFDKIGGFDAARVAGEDADFCLRLQQAGARLRFDADLATYHYGESTSIRDFVRRQFFHAEPLGVVLKSVHTSPMNAAILIVMAATVAGVVAAIAGLLAGWAAAPLLLLLGPLVLLTVATAKALPGWDRSKGLKMLAQMVAASALLVATRTIGTIWQPARH